jgi:hypothetical protein
MSEPKPDTPAESTEQQQPEAGVGISDDQLPEDLQPTDDNPLAKPLDEDGDDDGDSGFSPTPDGPPAVG